MEGSETDRRRAEMLERWERSAVGWGRWADRVRDFGMPVAVRMIERLALQPGQRILELAAGPGDTGFLAAELVRPGGTLLSSDGAEAMVALARARARKLGITNIEFLRLELEWIDLPTASVDAALCRWGLMLSLDPAAALQEVRRVLRPGGRVALAVWDLPEHNLWATIPTRALIELGHVSPPEPGTPGMFALAAPGMLRELLESAGFVEATVESVEVDRRQGSLDEYLAEVLDLSVGFAETFDGLDEDARAAVRARIAALAEPLSTGEGELLFCGRSLVAAASA